MDSGFFLLLRFFLRIDLVTFLLKETRVYHRFSSDKVLLQVSGTKIGHDKMKEFATVTTGASDVAPFLSDENWVGNAMMVTDKNQRPIPGAEVETFRNEVVLL